ncbi:MAG: TIGR00730 family Rossman fold protein [Candidatus Cryptobacteroides sp.]
MNKEKKLVIFCSASYDIDQVYNQAAREIVRAACLRGYTIVSGGAIKGTMGVVADEVKASGGKHIGVLPHFMAEFKYPDIDELIWTDTMSERKTLMREGTDVAIALPGGIGTLDELVETHVLAKLDKYHGRIFALNINGFFNPLKELYAHYVATGMMTEIDRDIVKFTDSVKELEEYL